MQEIWIWHLEELNVDQFHMKLGTHDIFVYWQTLGVAPENCLVVEDSVIGLKVVWAVQLLFYTTFIVNYALRFEMDWSLLKSSLWLFFVKMQSLYTEVEEQSALSFLLINVNPCPLPGRIRSRHALYHLLYILHQYSGTFPNSLPKSVVSMSPMAHSSTPNTPHVVDSWIQRLKQCMWSVNRGQTPSWIATVIMEISTN